MGNFFLKNKKHFVFGVSLLVIFLVLKFVFPLVLPFLLAVVLVAAIYPAVDKIHNKIGVGKGFLAGIFLLLIFSGLGGALWYFGIYGIHWIGEQIQKMDEYQEKFIWFVETCSEKVEKSIGVKANQVQNIILERVDIFIEDMQVKLLPAIMDQSLLYVKLFIGIVTFLVVMIIAAILIIKDYDVMKEKLSHIKQYEEIVALFKKMGSLLFFFSSCFCYLYGWVLFCWNQVLCSGWNFDRNSGCTAICRDWNYITSIYALEICEWRNYKGHDFVSNFSCCSHS